MKGLHVVTALAVSVSYASMAHAQVTTPAPDAPAAAAAAPQDDTPTAAPKGDIVVTGSRLARNGSQAPTPVTMVAAEDLQKAAPSNIPDALNKLPVFTNSRSQYSGQTFSATASPMGNYLNLRGLEPQRMLVLLNGSRVPPTTNSNAVDTNMLPQLLVSRVDVVTGGASATYGSDAVSGVVNFVLDEKFSGIKMLAQTGVSDKGDAFSYRVGAAVGTDIGDRIHVIASYDHYDSDGLPDNLFYRKWAHGAPITTGAGTAANPYTLTPNARTKTLSDGGVINSGPLAGLQFAPNGSLVPFNAGLPTGSADIGIGGDGAIYNTAMAARLRTDQAFLRANVDLTDSIQLFLQGSYGRSESGYNTDPDSHRTGTNRNTVVSIDNPYLRPDVVARMQAAGVTSVSIGRQFNDVPQMTQESVTKFYNAQVGLKGDLGGSWKWDANYVYGRSTLDFQTNEFSSRNYFAAIDAVRDPASGKIVCGVTLRNPGLVPGCVPMNVIGAGNIDPAAFAFARQDSKYRIVNEMNYANVNLQGDLFNLPGGPVSLAVGAEYRTQKLRQTSNSDPAIWSGPGGAAARTAYFQGIANVPASALLYTVTNVGIASGTQDVKEAYGEMRIPLLKGVPFARNLEFNLAARYTDYKTSGAVTTWKIGGSWTPIEGVRIRATQSRDIAAPSLYDLNAGANVNNIAVIDPMPASVPGVTNTNPVIQRTTAGNPNLEPEKAQTTVVGIVLQPRFIPNLTLSVDAYRIKINGAIQTASEQDEVNQCYASGGTAPVCSLITRDPTQGNTIAAVRVLPQNLGFLKTQGIDFELNYRIPLDSLLPSVGGRIDLRAFVGYLDKYDTQSPGQPVTHRAGYVIQGTTSNPAGLPQWKGMLSQIYTSERFTFGLSERFTGNYRRGVQSVYFTPGTGNSPNRTYVDANLAFDIGGKHKFEWFLNVQNLFDVTPPIRQPFTATDNGVPTDKTIYDIVGRYITTGVRLKF